MADQPAKRSEPKLRDATYLDGIAIKPVYGPADLAGFDPAAELGEPGQYPFTRGIHPQMYRARTWTMRQYIGFGTPADLQRARVVDQLAFFLWGTKSGEACGNVAKTSQ